ncbi:MAG: MMPL family transporter [Eubacteriales bacterium]|nr:MMPL family transporter [Eubacteriales bacterium]
MEKKSEKKSFFEKLATLIVDKRNLIFFIYIAALIFSVFSRNWVSVCNELTDYLPEDTETRRGLTAMEEELVTYGTARIMVSNVTWEAADYLAGEIEEVDGVSSVEFDRTEEHFKQTDALFDVSFSGEADEEISLEAMSEIKAIMEPFDTYIDSEVGESLASTLDSEMGMIMVIAVVIIVLVLLLTSGSYAEVPVLLLTFGAAALLNMGTNFLFGEISFVSNSVSVILQLALAIDYAIILLHRFIEEKEEHDTREACIIALSSAIPAISASSLTTISGLAAMMFMQFRIGYDLGIVLIKAILLSMLSVFTLMPGLLMLFAKPIEKTAHKKFLPEINLWGKFVVKTRYIGVPAFLAVMVAGFFISQDCPYAYSQTSITTSRQNESQIAKAKINDTFGEQNVMALLVPKGDYEKEQALLKRLENYDEVNYAMGLANVEAIDGYMLTDGLTPRQFSEMADVDYELAELLYAAYAAHNDEYGKIVGGLDSYSIPLMDIFFFLYDQKEEGYVTLDDDLNEDLNDMYWQLSDAKAQMMGENYSRMVIDLNLAEEGEETFAFLNTIHREAEQYYDADEILLVGNSTSAYDLSTSFARDNIIISVVSVVLVVAVLLITFQSVGLPILLILVIEGSIWINFSFPALQDKPVFFMSYLIVSSIQMGANIDYAIVISNWYSTFKKTMSRKDAVIKTLNMSFPTIVTSGTILVSAAFLIGKLSTEPSIVGIGECLCRGTAISMVLVMLILPQILMLGDWLVEKTSFSLKKPDISIHHEIRTLYVDGRVRGRLSGVVDADIHGYISGDVSGVAINGSNFLQKGDNNYEDQEEE